MNKYYKITHNEKERWFLIAETLLAVGAAPTSFARKWVARIFCIVFQKDALMVP